LEKRGHSTRFYSYVQELVHLLVPAHKEKFISLLDKFYPNWGVARMELNELPLGHVEWK
jgi:predicted metal-dependent hydrolase